MTLIVSGHVQKCWQCIKLLDDFDCQSTDVFCLILHQSNACKTSRRKAAAHFRITHLDAELISRPLLYLVATLLPICKYRGGRPWRSCHLQWCQVASARQKVDIIITMNEIFQAFPLLSLHTTNTVGGEWGYLDTSLGDSLISCCSRSVGQMRECCKAPVSTISTCTV